MPPAEETSPCRWAALTILARLSIAAGPVFAAAILYLKPDHAGCWLMMEIEMMIGFATSYPVNSVLTRVGV